MMRITGFTLLLQLVALPVVHLETEPIEQIYSEGDITIGGVFPVHEKGTGVTPCGSLNKERGIQRLEAMRFAVQHVNHNKSLLRGINIGVKILDTCSDPTYALDRSLDFVMSTLVASQKDRCPDLRPSNSFSREHQEPESHKGSNRLVAVVGAAYSSVSIQIANLLRLFKIPQISYASTSAELSNKERYGYFMRTVPPDKLQAKALVDIVNYFNWTFISTVASDGDYGISGIDSFKTQYKADGKCIAAEKKVPDNPTDEDFKYIVKDLYNVHSVTGSKAKVVILFVRQDDAAGILKAASSLKYYDDFIWVASDGWGDVRKTVKGNERTAQGALTITLKSHRIDEFDQYFKKLNPQNNNYKWFQEYWQQTHNCTIKRSNTSRQLLTNGPLTNKKVKYCFGNETDENYQQESKIQFVIDAVYATAMALDRLYREVCGENATAICHHLTFNDTMRQLLMKYIKENKHDDPYGNMVRFDEKGDSLGYYNIMNYRWVDTSKSYEYVNVGSWDNINKLQLDMANVMWPNPPLPPGQVPRSVCSLECEPGWRKELTNEQNCCWKCEECESNELLSDEFTCKACPTGEWPYENKTGCQELELKYVKWHSPFAIIPAVFSIAGLITTIGTTMCLIKHMQTPVVRAASRELSFYLLIGIGLCYVGAFVLLLKPTKISCILQRFFVSGGFTFIYSPLLMKTNRLYRIFNIVNNPSSRKARFISPRSQIIITGCLTVVQFIVTIVWLILEEPGIKTEQPDSNDKAYVVLKCNYRESSLLISLSYNMLLIIVCTIHAVLARHVPSDFNDSKYIGFTMYTTCIVWLSFCPVYFGLKSSYQIQVTTLCTAIILSASVALACLYGPKLYIILYHPEKNVRKSTTGERQRVSSSLRHPRQDVEMSGKKQRTGSSLSADIKLPNRHVGGKASYETDTSAVPEKALLIDERSSSSGRPDSDDTLEDVSRLQRQEPLETGPVPQGDELTPDITNTTPESDKIIQDDVSDILGRYADSDRVPRVVAEDSDKVPRVVAEHDALDLYNLKEMIPLIPARDENITHESENLLPNDDEYTTNDNILNTSAEKSALGNDQSDSWDSNNPEGTELPERLI